MAADELTEVVRRGPFDVALRHAIGHRGLSLTRLRAHLARIDVPVAESTLSYWQRGLRRPDPSKGLATVRGLEIVLGLPIDSLVVLVGARRRGDRRRQVASFAELTAHGSITSTLLRQLGVDPDTCNAGLELVLTQDRMVVSAQRCQDRVTTQIVARARTAGIDRYVVIYNTEPTADINEVEVRAGIGCRLGRTRRDGYCLAFELMFDRALGEDETVVFGYVVLDHTGAEWPGYYRQFRESSGPYLLQCDLTPTCLPARMVQEVRTSDQRPPTVARDLYVDRTGVISAYYPVTSAGLSGISLEWV